MIHRLCFLLGIYFLCAWGSSAGADTFAYNETRASFENFIRCELTRTDANNHFGGRDFTITMVNFYNVQAESDIKIVTGAVDCFVENEVKTLYVALGLNRVLDKEKVSYYLIRKKDFSILATELIQHPYKERCPWSQYWIDTD